MVKWIRSGIPISDRPAPSNRWGFIYLIRYTNGQCYIGKKQFWSVTRKPFGKKKLAEVTDKRHKKYEMIVKENDWRTYVGSSKETKHLVIESKEILELCEDKVNLTYCEVKWMFKYDVLVDATFLNSNILGKFFVGKIKGTQC